MDSFFSQCLVFLGLLFTSAGSQTCNMVSKFDASLVFGSSDQLPPPIQELQTGNANKCSTECCNKDDCNVAYFYKESSDNDTNCQLYSCRPTTMCGYLPQKDVRILVNEQDVMSYNSLSSTTSINVASSSAIITSSTSPTLVEGNIVATQTVIDMIASVQTNVTITMASTNLATESDQSSAKVNVSDSSNSMTNDTIMPSQSIDSFFATSASISSSGGSVSPNFESNNVTQTTIARGTENISESPSNVTSSVNSFPQSQTQNQNQSQNQSLTSPNSTSILLSTPSLPKQNTSNTVDNDQNNSTTDRGTTSTTPNMHLTPPLATSVSVLSSTQNFQTHSLNNSSGELSQHASGIRTEPLVTSSVNIVMTETSSFQEVISLPESGIIEGSEITSSLSLTSSSVLYDALSTNGSTKTTGTDSTMDNPIKILLFCSLAFGCVFILAVVGILGKLFFDGYKKRHYSRLDYLINGIY